MNVPVRPAPAPPGKDRRNIQGSFFDWDDGNDPFFGSQPSTFVSNQLTTAKKKPPPRPPPPKFENKKQQKQVSSQGRFVGLFTRYQRTNTSNRSKPNNQKNHATSLSGSCRPYSPSPTSRSSSDGVSVNSFGSDGSFSNNTAIGGNASIFESGFEEDFDFWLSTSTKPQANEQNDPWKVTQQDPFSPPPQTPQQMVHSASFPVQKLNTTSWFDELSKPIPPAPSTLKSAPLYGSVPTIIRPKPNRSTQPPKLVQNGAPEKKFQSHSIQHAFSALTLSDTSVKLNTRETEETSDYEDQDDWEPPMPSIPPPPPPPEVVEELAKIAPPIPPKPLSQIDNQNKPHGVALFDYDSPHPDDLSFKENDVIILKRRINADWLYGQLGQKEGMFPSNFINVIVPLDNEGDFLVKALYQFIGETTSDLEFPEGAFIKVLSRISADWLYGEYEGRRGQFPATYVDHIPSGLPDYSN
ncbi:SH3 domain-containing protein 19 [Schistocerca nitens]|uniref:SH3 domain-containing protein 19 n=1 Tax=Schistocerca nitens TaxID=7011 RepID=UPI0021178BC0|nr:SH3 domain-containing protein 19 [Schistocerca nitens]